jgi:hypothetical protein
MSHGHASQEGEHAAHHAQDPFDRRVAMSMVVIAAVLAAVKVVGHRAHNETLVYQVKSNVAHTQASDQWSYFQAKKNRLYLYESQAQLLSLLGARDGKNLAFAPEDEEDGAAFVRAPAGIGASTPDKKKKKRELSEEDRRKVEELVKKGCSKQAAERIVVWQSEAGRYSKEADDIEREARRLTGEGVKYQKLSEHEHHQADRFDLGELFVELALVVSSVAILSKKSGFWYAGIALCAVGLAVVATGFFVH